MAKQIEISDWAYEAISAMMSKDDTAASVISRLVKAKLPLEDMGADTRSHNTELNFHLAGVPDLSFTNVISVKLNGQKIATNKWNSVRNEVIKLGLKENINLADVSSIGMIKGEKTDGGYKFYEQMGISIQGQSANDCWKACSDICSLIDATIEVLVQWRDNEKAAYPGQKARLLIP